MATARSDAPRKVTAAQFTQFPDDFPPHSQLIQGQVVVSEPTIVHARIQRFIENRLGQWCDAGTDRGEVFVPIDVPINEWNVFAPDVLWFSEGRRPPRGAVRADSLPDLAVEVRSPSTWRYDVGPKFAQYERAGLDELWFVDTVGKTVLIYRRSSPDQESFDIAVEAAEGETLSSPLLPGFSLDVTELFDR